MKIGKYTTRHIDEINSMLMDMELELLTNYFKFKKSRFSSEFFMHILYDSALHNY